MIYNDIYPFKPLYTSDLVIAVYLSPVASTISYTDIYEQ